MDNKIRTETKDLKFTLDSLDDEAGTFTGYASVFGVIDSYGDVVQKGAFRKSLREKKKFPMLWSHDVREPIGVIGGYEDDKGLCIEGALNLDVPRAQWTRSLMKQYKDAGTPMGLSIGYQVVVKDIDKSGLRKLKEIKLWEISPVVFPACNPAQVDGVKSDELDELDEKGEWTTMYINALPNAAFAVVETGYKEGDDKRARHLPHHTKNVQSATEDETVDVEHLRAALSRMNQVKSVLGKDTDEGLRSKAVKHLVGHAKRMGIGDWGKMDEQLESLLELKPYPNNHTCDLDTSLKVVGSMTRKHNGKEYTVRIGRDADGESGEHSYLYPKDTWDAADAASHCKSHGGTFIAATSKCLDCNAQPDDEPDGTSTPSGPALSHSQVTRLLTQTIELQNLLSKETSRE